MQRDFYLSIYMRALHARCARSPRERGERICGLIWIAKYRYSVAHVDPICVCVCVESS